MNRDEIKTLAKRIRRKIIESSYKTGKTGIHIGPALSIVDFFSVIYGGMANINPSLTNDFNRDRIILSKGHAYAALYSTLCLCGFISEIEFADNYMTDGGLYPAHPIKQIDKGIECSSGSLGLGLSFAVGKALAAKRRNLTYTTYVAMGDGECNEGSTFEAFLSAVQFGLDNLVVFIDNNSYQQDGKLETIMNVPVAEYLNSIGCDVKEIDGNDVDEICSAIESLRCHNSKPKVIVGHTIKGKGVPFMENDNSWHHAILNEEQYNQAINELS